MFKFFNVFILLLCCFCVRANSISNDLIHDDICHTSLPLKNKNHPIKKYGGNCDIYNSHVSGRNTSASSVFNGGVVNLIISPLTGRGIEKSPNPSPLSQDESEDNGVIDIVSRLTEIKEQLKTMNNTFIGINDKSSWKYPIKQIAPIFLSFIAFMWGAMQLTASEARARMSYITPLIDSSHSSVREAYDKLLNNIPISNGDITNIIEPIVRIKPFLSQYDIVEFFICSNKRAFNLMRMSIPSSVITEVKSRDILNKFISAHSNSIEYNWIIQTLTDQYDTASRLIVDYNEIKSPLYVLALRVLIVFIFVAIVCFLTFVYGS